MDFIPITIIAAGALMAYLSKQADESLKPLFFFMSIFMIPAAMAACVHLSVADTNTAMEQLSASLMEGFLIVNFALLAIWILLFISKGLNKAGENS